MTDKERQDFWNKAKLLSGINEGQIRYLERRLKKESNYDIFEHYYDLVSLLRNRLEASLEGEQASVARFLQDNSPDFFNKAAEEREAEQALSPMWKAMLKAGVSLEQLKQMTGEPDKGADEEGEEWSERLTRANTYIALFSRYRIDIPYSFIYEIISKNSGGNPYSENGRELFEILTSRIPWLSCGENDDGEFVFRFRNSREADIFLERHNIQGGRLVDMAKESLKLYGESVARDQYDDPRLAQKLQSLVRLMGPNSKYYAANHDKHNEHKAILKHLAPLITTINDLLTEYRIPDEDCGFALLLVTLTREYYGKNVRRYAGTESQKDMAWADVQDRETLEYRIQAIAKASYIARNSELDLEATITSNRGDTRNGYLRRQANGLIVEATRCDLELEELRAQYREECKQRACDPDPDVFSGSPSYQLQCDKLMSAIESDPFNGYAYNALFSLFEKEYESGRLTDDERLECLAEIMMLINSSRAYGSNIENRGPDWDELSDHQTRISEYGDKIPASMDMIENGMTSLDTRDSSSFIKLYNTFLEDKNPAAILFVCQKELNKIKMDAADATGKLNTVQIELCNRVLKFMTEPERLACVRTNPNALAFLIRVAWMAFNGTSLNETKECVTTSITRDQWIQLRSFCEAYVQEAPPSSQQPILVLLYALSVLQAKGTPNKDSYLDAWSIVEKIDEEQFNSQYRLRTPFIICDESGTPLRFVGTVQYVREKTGFMRVGGMPDNFGNKSGVYFRQYNLGRNAIMPEIGSVMPDLELGLGYMGFALFTDQGRCEIGR